MASGTPALGGLAVTHPLLLDEMFSDEIAEQLRTKGHDVRSVVADPSLVALSDDQILSEAGAAGRALVTANIKDFAPLDRECKAIRRTHAGLVLVSTKTFPQNRSYAGAVVTALDKLLTGSPDLTDLVVFLER
jgi:Domain of unknown function (DUF5615)